jgi:hypothetical protein
MLDFLALHRNDLVMLVLVIAGVQLIAGAGGIIKRRKNMQRIGEGTSGKPG